MHGVTIREQVDMNLSPKMDKSIQVTEGLNVEVTIGDLHANLKKIFYFLKKHGVIENLEEVKLETSLKDASTYQKLLDICSRSTQLALKNNKAGIKVFNKDLKVFKSLLTGLKFNTNTLVRLIGDELSDRAGNDYLMLLLIKTLRDRGVTLEIMFSNHSLNFIKAYEQICRAEKEKPNQTDKNETIQLKTELPRSQSASMINLQKLMNAGVVSKKELDELMEDSYYPSVKLLSYTLSDDQKHISLFSHAPIGLNTIKEMAEKFNVSYQDNSAKALADTIDNINSQFRIHLQNKTVTTLFEYENIEAFSQGRYVKGSPFAAATWNRNLEALKKTTPKNHQDYCIDFIHGHNLEALKKENVHNLDNKLGKNINNLKGEYSVYYSSAKAFELTPQRKALQQFEKMYDITHSLVTLCKQFNWKLKSEVNEIIKNVKLTVDEKIQQLQEKFPNFMSELGDELKKAPIEDSQPSFNELEKLTNVLSNNKIDVDKKTNRLQEFYDDKKDQFNADIKIFEKLVSTKTNLSTIQSLFQVLDPDVLSKLSSLEQTLNNKDITCDKRVEQCLKEFDSLIPEIVRSLQNTQSLLAELNSDELQSKVNKVKESVVGLVEELEDSQKNSKDKFGYFDKIYFYKPEEFKKDYQAIQVELVKQTHRQLSDLTQNCLNDVRTDSDSYNVIKELNEKLNQKKEPSQTIDDFFNYLHFKTTKESTETNLDILKKDSSLSIVKLLAGIIAVLAIIATGIIPGLAVNAMVYAITDCSVTDLFRPNVQKSYITNMQKNKEQARQLGIFAAVKNQSEDSVNKQENSSPANLIN